MKKSSKQKSRRIVQKTGWAPTEQEQAILTQYSARKSEGSTIAPPIKIAHGDVTEVSIDYPKEALGAVLLAKAFGVASLGVALGLVDQLVGASQRNGKSDETCTNFMVSIVKGIKPKDELEAMLAAQMAAVHVATMTFARRLAGVENIPQQDSAERAFNKLARTFTAQLEALKRYRTGGEQRVTVQHIDVRGGQAIVGDVSQGAHQPGSASAVKEPPALMDSRAEPMPILSERARSMAPVKRKSA